MAKIEFVEGVRCKQCGNIITGIYAFTPELCQKCGTKIINIHIGRKSYTTNDNGEDVIVKVTHKFFRDIYEVVEAQQ